MSVTLSKAITHAIVLGTFMPPHAGHRLLLDYARAWSDALTIVLLASKTDPIAVSQRAAWLRALSPGSAVMNVMLVALPAHGAEPDAWIQPLRDALPEGVTGLFGTDGHDAAIAAALGLPFHGLDPEHAMVTVSSSAIRNDPMSNWDYIPECVRSAYVRRVCVYGPRGTGKSALVEQLTIHYDTAWAMDMRLSGNQPLEPEDMEGLAKSQAIIEDALARQSNRVLICDGGVPGMAMRAEVAFKTCAPALMQMAKACNYDQILLMDLDPAFIETAPKKRLQAAQGEFERYRQALIVDDRRYLRLDGDYDTRFRIACDAIDILIEQPTRRPPRPDM